MARHWRPCPFWTGIFLGPGHAQIMFYYPGDENWWLGNLPAPTVSPGCLEVFAAGSYGVLGRTWQTAPGGGWSAWVNLWSARTGNPVVARNADGRLEVFAKGPDGNLGHSWETTPGGAWFPWQDLGPAITGDPAVAQNADGRLEVFARGPDGKLGHIWQNVASTTTNWSSWADFGSVPGEWTIRGNPAVARNADGRLEVFAVAPVSAGPPALGHIWQVAPNGGWSAWTNFSAIPGEWAIRGDLAVALNADGRLEVFAIGPDGNLGHSSQTTPGGTWYVWTDLGPRITTRPAAALH